MKIIAFTICSNNYIPQASTMLKTWSKYHPEAITKLVLLDTYHFDSKLYENLEGTEIIPVADMNIKEFDKLALKYNIVELSTAIKPDSFIYLFEKYEPDAIIYFDPDIMFTGRCGELLDKLETSDIILTPHMITPVDDGFFPSDVDILKGGVYNLGFGAFARYNSVKKILTWWRDRLHKYAFADFSKNLFTDQLWMDYLPCYYDNYHILKHPGYNVANWNLHERNITLNSESKYTVSNIYEMKFFHFSGYRYNTPGTISWYHTRYKLEDSMGLKKLFEEYHKNLKEANYELYVNTPCTYIDLYRSHQDKIAKEAYKKLPLQVKIGKKIAGLGRKIIYRK